MTQFTILLADDDDIQRTRMSRWASEAGFRVLDARDGVEALQLVRQNTPDMVVTDLHMPRVGGKQLIPLLREVPGMRERPIVVVTADMARSTKIQLLESGADDYMVKPVDPEEFQARLRAQARRSSLANDVHFVRAQWSATSEELRRRTAELEQLNYGLVAALEKANKWNDNETGNHIRRVAETAALVAHHLDCSPEYVDMLRRYASLHDVGKVGIPDSILKHPGRLTPEMFEIMKTHTLIGADLLRSAGLPEIAVNIPLCHHEKWDSSGYPRGLRGTAIPLEARIVAVVDVFDALRSKRCYKPAFTQEESVRILQRDSGSHFDPQVVEIFLQNLDEINDINSRYEEEPMEEQKAAWE
jgi:putative two-component system response regulator